LQGTKIIVQGIGHFDDTLVDYATFDDTLVDYATRE
jgi:hypothetical protein